MQFQHTDTSLPIESEYPKLVRDNIPDIIESQGKVAHVRPTKDDDEYIRYLLKKVVEEATELSQTADDIHMVEEMADVYEVLDALLATKKLSRQDVLNVQREKRKKRGGFEKRLIMADND